RELTEPHGKDKAYARDRVEDLHKNGYTYLYQKNSKQDEEALKYLKNVKWELGLGCSCTQETSTVLPPFSTIVIYFLHEVLSATYLTKIIFFASKRTISLICQYEPPYPHIVMNIYNEEKVRKASEVHDARKSVGYATTAACLVYGSELVIIGIFRTDTSTLYHKYLCMTLIGFLLCGIAISVMLNDKIRFRDESHRGCYAVYAFYALAIATLMVVVMLT
nr:hypothetical protein [Tanacetum cinerariifolium]